MRAISKKREQEKREGEQARTDFAFQFDNCMACGDAWRADNNWPYVLDIHEIARGPARQEAIKHRACWLRLCRKCHEAMGDLNEWPIEKQLAVKKLCDLKYYDRQLVNRLRGRDENAVTEQEVIEWVGVLLQEKWLNEGGVQ